MTEEAVQPQTEPIEQIMDQQEVGTNVQEGNEEQAEKQSEKTMIPLSVAQKLRQQKRELELELQWERQKAAQAANPAPIEDDNSRYESATREDLKTSQEEAVRLIEEKLWIRQNPEKYERVNQELEQLLKLRPNLGVAIKMSSNRYEEAYTLIEALSPKQQIKKTTAAPKKEAPNAPGNIPKGAALNDALDVMNMSDTEFQAWRQSKRTRR